MSPKGHSVALDSRQGGRRTLTGIAPLATVDLGRRYRRGGAWALQRASLELGPGTITALVGPNGAGKSTLIRCCIGFERPDAGQVLIGGLDPRRDRARVVEQVGYVPQASSLYRDLTVGDHFGFAAGYRRRFDGAYAVRRTTSVGIGLDRRVGELSGGEQAQVALAMALALHAPVLLLDEPLASLDPLARREFLTTLVEEVRESGATALLSSHIVTDVEQACDALIVMTGGQIALHANVHSVLVSHRTGDPGAVAREELVATFLDPTGNRIALARTTDEALRPAALEEVVLGYLAAARTTPAATA